MSKVLIDRELLERIAKSGMEVVAWQDAENPLYTTGEKRQMHGWATDGYPIVELVRKSDADARDAMRLEMLAGEAETNVQLRLELHAAQERIAELEAAITSCLPCSYYMDLPDGGSNSLEEQLRRMAKDAADQRAAEHRLKEVASHCATVEQELAALKAQEPVVMPEYASSKNVSASIFWINGWNACLDEFAHLNGGQAK